jgi:ribonuclease P protein subunit POP4
MRNKENILIHEFIGLPCEVVSSLSIFLKGIKGIVVDETLNTIILDTEKGIKNIPKKNTKFQFTIPENKEKIIVNGNDIINLPENRPKRIIRRL